MQGLGNNCNFILLESFLNSVLFPCFFRVGLFTVKEICTTYEDMFLTGLMEPAYAMGSCCGSGNWRSAFV